MHYPRILFFAPIFACFPSDKSGGAASHAFSAKSCNFFASSSDSRNTSAIFYTALSTQNALVFFRCLCNGYNKHKKQSGK